MAENRNEWVAGPIEVRKGLVLYKKRSSPYYFARLRDTQTRRYVVRSTKRKTEMDARRAAEEWAVEFYLKAPAIPRSMTFEAYADRFIRSAVADSKSGARSPRYAKDARNILDNKEWGLLASFASKDVRSLTTTDWYQAMQAVLERRPDLSSSTHIQRKSIYRKVMTQAVMEGVISAVPDTPLLMKKKTTARPFFRFDPLVSKEDDQYQLVLRTAKQLAETGAKVRGVPITDELYDLILFTTHSFVRPTYSELYALKHSDVMVSANPKRLVTDNQERQNRLQKRRHDGGCCECLQAHPGSPQRLQC